ncbi:hypothetical protein [Methylobacterium sp. Leaf99]|uniref:hypothetical protein n=1 Tax=Methylobacterium sp. Leaf99 TaxID=1736251 RepID=UPI001AEBECE5|nr:hypothetical protein [Methylobacterium sp. Leaf99]
MPESGAQAGQAEATRKKDAEVHPAVDTLEHLPALQVTPTDANDRARPARPAGQRLQGLRKP